MAGGLDCKGGPHCLHTVQHFPQRLRAVLIYNLGLHLGLMAPLGDSLAERLGRLTELASPLPIEFAHVASP